MAGGWWGAEEKHNGDAVLGVALCDSEFGRGRGILASEPLAARAPSGFRDELKEVEGGGLRLGVRDEMN